MGLITCSDCGHEVSDRAKSCPNCGGPMEDVQVIEATSKEWKGPQLAGCIVAVAGMLMILGAGQSINSDQLGIAGLLVVGGFLLFFGARIAAWWHHG